MRWLEAAPRLLAAASLLVGLAFGSTAMAQQSAAATVALAETAGTIDAQPHAKTWLDDQGTATIEQVIAHADAGRMQAAPSSDAMYRLGPAAAL